MPVEPCRDRGRDFLGAIPATGAAGSSSSRLGGGRCRRSGPVPRVEERWAELAGRDTVDTLRESLALVLEQLRQPGD